jgi:Holliday junction resolvase RusA-like endonuclease
MTIQHVKFALLGPCVPWHRSKQSRSNRIDGRGARHYKDPADVAFQLALGLEATSAMMKWAHSNQAQWNAEGEWRVDMEFYVQDLVKRDIDNLEKQVLDSLTGVCYDDDKQVCAVSKFKMLSRTKPRTVVTVSRVEGYLDDH